MSHGCPASRRSRLAAELRRGGVALGALALALSLSTVDAIADDAPATPSTPATPALDVHPAHLEDVEHMCALLTGCGGLPIPDGLVPRDFATCVRAMYAELASPSAVAFPLTLRECGLHASSCNTLRTCALRGARADVCKGRGRSGAVDMCDSAGRAVTCVDEHVTLVRDCPRGGEQCSVRDGKATCTLGRCEADAAPACSASGTRIVECKGGRLLSMDCAALGLRCVTTPAGPRCATPRPACAKDAHRCDGAVAVGCHEGHEVRVDCAGVGMSCAPQKGPESVGECVQASTKAACNERAPAKCDKATVRYCMGGRGRAYLCKSMGFSGCTTDARGAHCVN